MSGPVVLTRAYKCMCFTSLFVFFHFFVFVHTDIRISKNVGICNVHYVYVHVYV